MWKCPVCEEISEGLLCESCGFDGSRDYERYPSFGALSVTPEAVSVLRKKRAGLKKRYLRCPNCNGHRFLLEFVSAAPFCANCGKKFMQKQIEEQQKAVHGQKQTVVAEQTFLVEPPKIPASGCSVITTDVHVKRELDCWKNIIALSIGKNDIAGLRTEGYVLTNTLSPFNSLVARWKKITAIASGGFHIVGLREDGSVIAVGDNENGQCNVVNWNRISAVEAGGFHTVGLQANGKVLAVGANHDGRCNVEKWSQITAISAGGFHTVGLQADGKVVASGANHDGRCNVEKWDHIVQIAAGHYHTVALRNNGTVLAAGRNVFGQCNVDRWTNIVSVVAGGNRTVGLRADGTVVSTDPKDPVQSWERIVAIAVGDSYIAALQLPEEK